MKSAFDRFSEKVHRTDSGCWEWLGATSDEGYGMFGFFGKVIYVHRFTYEAFRRSIPDRAEIDHVCRNRLCVNPFHLEAVTKKTNILRGFGACAENARKTHCKHGHAFDETNTYYARTRLGGIGRYCRECRRAATQRNQSKHKNL